MTDPSPSEPVESHEQPREERHFARVGSAPTCSCGETFPSEVWLLRHQRDALRSSLAAALASIRNLETLRDVHRRTIDDLISEAQTAGATIDELRADVERRMKPWQDRDIYATMTRAEPAMRDELLAAWNARDEAFADAARLREQGEAVGIALQMEQNVHDRGDFDRGVQAACTSIRHAMANPQAFLNPTPAAREGE